MKTIYTTTEIADLLSVNESTIKRWADSGYIECARTKGGHRRFPLSAVMRFIQENKLQLPEIASRFFDKRELHAQLLIGNKSPLTQELKKAGLEGDVDAALEAMRIGLAAKPDLLSFYSDVLFPPLKEIGDDWAKGRITVDVEHLATHTTREALMQLQTDLHYKDLNGLTAVCSCYQGEQHEIALYTVSSYLTVEGWQVYHLGADTPTKDLVSAIERRRPNLVVLSAVIIEQEQEFLKDIAQIILPAVRQTGGKLAVGGAGISERFGKRLKADFVSDSILDYRVIGHPKNFTRS